jgi:hypothetical protein
MAIIRPLDSRRALALGMGACLMTAVLAVPKPAQAIDRDVKAVLVASEYGMLGGTVLGLAALPFSQDIRNVFIGTSVGLYLGIAVGIYYVYNRYEEENPLRPRYQDSHRSDQSKADPWDRERELRTVALTRTGSGLELARAREPLSVAVPVLRF